MASSQACANPLRDSSLPQSWHPYIGGLLPISGSGSGAAKKLRSNSATDAASNKLTVSKLWREPEDGTRTRDLLITNQLLYQLSYFGTRAKRKDDAYPSEAWARARSPGSLAPRHTR